MLLTVTIPMRLESSANGRGSWRIAWAREREQKNTVYAHLLRALNRRDRVVPNVVTITRIAPKALDSDNNIRAAKHVRDTIARVFGVDDGPRGPIEWRYDQRRGAWAVEIGLELPGELGVILREVRHNLSSENDGRDLERTKVR